MFVSVSVIVSSVVAFSGGGFLLTASRAAQKAPVLGVIGASGRHLFIEKTSDVRSLTLIMSWADAEPTRTSTSAAYMASINSRVRAAKADGFSVSIDPGIQYPPAWVFALSGGTRFVDQYGDQFAGAPSSGNDVANGITDLQVRAAMQSYLRWLGAHLALGDVTSVRQGGGPFDELRYPDPDYDGHTNCYWAYDTSSLKSSPALSYVPGTSTPTRARAFLDRYNDDLVSFADWMNTQYRTDFRRQILLLLPGWGQRPGIANLEERYLLQVPYAEFNEGLDWTGLLASLPDRAATIAYTTYLDAPSYSTDAQEEDPADYLASVARPLHMSLGGENTGTQTVAAMEQTLGRARALDLQVVNWFGEAQLLAADADPSSGEPTFADLDAVAKAEL